MSINFIIFLKYYRIRSNCSKIFTQEKRMWVGRKVAFNQNVSIWEMVDSVQFSSLAQSCPTLCDPVDCSTPGFPVHHLLELTQTHVHQLVMPSNHFILCHPLLFPLQSFPASGSFPRSQFFSAGGQSFGVSFQHQSFQ